MLTLYVLNAATPLEGSDDIPIVAAASPAIWSLTIVDPSAIPDGQTWNIFLTGGPPRKTARADNDDVGPAVTVIDQQVVVPGSPSIIPDAWRITWFPRDRAYK
ncbi:hypothetical protein Hypma_009334 [Hypsizygus marmoreus]|uniref:Uncharacterized protein n=1 Tax=Hypsizygus marmoreus TaxID=39966 RepID=A0A369JTM1_HYPMA|nr:hypothetical protein Hypma_009334 [Hypsizygus marmoreus]